MKVLIVDNSKRITGAFVSILSMANNMPDIDFLFALPSEHNIKKVRADGHKGSLFNFIEIQKNWRILFYIPALLINTFRIIRIIKQEKIDVLHVNDLYNMVGVMVRLFRVGVKLAYHVRLLPTSYARVLFPYWIYLIRKFADQIICVSNAVSSSIPADKKKVIVYDGVKAVQSQKKKSDDIDVKVLFPANYIEGKGHFYALEAFEKSFSLNPNLELKYVGDDMGLVNNRKYKEKLNETVDKMRLRQNVVLGGYSKDVNSEMEKVDIILMLSDSESFSMICAEAGIAGKPVIATRCGGPEEIVDDGETGILVDCGDVESISKAIDKLSKDQMLRIEMGEKARERCKNLFSISKSAKQLKNVYHRLSSVD